MLPAANVLDGGRSLVFLLAVMLAVEGSRES